MVRDHKNDAPIDLQAFIKEPPLLLKNFPHDEMMEFLSLGIEERYLPDEVIISGEEYVYTSYLIVEGKVTIVKNDMPIIDLSVGGFLGETFLFSKYNKIAKVVAKNECRLLRFERSAALDYFKIRQKKLFHIFTRNVITIQQVKLKKMNVKLFQLKKSLLNNSD